jgi:hypothetical protein
VTDEAPTFYDVIVVVASGEVESHRGMRAIAQDEGGNLVLVPTEGYARIVYAKSWWRRYSWTPSPLLRSVS